MHTERTELARYRLEADLGFRELAQLIGKSTGWVHQFLTSPKPQVSERSLYRVRTFLESTRKGKGRKHGAAA